MEDDMNNDNFLLLVKEGLEKFGIVKRTDIDNGTVLVVTLTNGQKFIIIGREAAGYLGRDYS